MMKLETVGMIHSKNAIDSIVIVEHIDNNHCVALYNGHLYTAVYNVFTGLYYVDDKYGLIS